MKSKEEIISKYNFICDPDVLETVEAMMEEYAQQQPGPRWVLEEIDFLEDCIKVTKEGGWSTHLVKPMQDRIEKLKNAYPQSFSVVLSGEGMSATNLKNG